MSQFVVECLPTGKLTLGEGPHWDAKSQKLYYVDILSKSVHSYDPKTKKECKVLILDSETAGVSFVIPYENESNKFIISVGSTLRVLDWDGNSNIELSQENLKVIAKCNCDESFNDAKVDTEGRLWAGTMGKLEGGKLDMKKAHLYEFNKNGKLLCHLEDLDLSNGLCWSPDNRVFYFIDSPTSRVDAFDYDITASLIQNRRPIYDLKAKEFSHPDGMCIDADGNLWVAFYGVGKVLHINAQTGNLIDEIEFPTLNITSVAFGGQDLDSLFVTTATLQLKEDPLTVRPLDGSLFQVTNLGTKGLSPGLPYAGSVGTK